MNDTAQGVLIDEFIKLVEEVKGENIQIPNKKLGNISLTEDLRLDSLDLINFLFRVEEEHSLKIPAEDFDDQGLVLLGNLATYIQEHATA